jgi:hypothetical protein
VGDVDLAAGHDGGDGVEVQVPACGGADVLGGGVDLVGEAQEGVVAVGFELPGEVVRVPGWPGAVEPQSAEIASSRGGSSR